MDKLIDSVGRDLFNSASVKLAEGFRVKLFLPGLGDDIPEDDDGTLGLSRMIPAQVSLKTQLSNKLSGQNALNPKPQSNVHLVRARVDASAGLIHHREPESHSHRSQSTGRSRAMSRGRMRRRGRPSAKPRRLTKSAPCSDHEDDDDLQPTTRANSNTAGQGRGSKKPPRPRGTRSLSRTASRNANGMSGYDSDNSGEGEGGDGEGLLAMDGDSFTERTDSARRGEYRHSQSDPFTAQQLLAAAAQLGAMDTLRATTEAAAAAALDLAALGLQNAQGAQSTVRSGGSSGGSGQGSDAAGPTTQSSKGASARAARRAAAAHVPIWDRGTRASEQAAFQTRRRGAARGNLNGEPRVAPAPMQVVQVKTFDMSLTGGIGNGLPGGAGLPGGPSMPPGSSGPHAMPPQNGAVVAPPFAANGGYEGAQQLPVASIPLPQGERAAKMTRSKSLNNATGYNMPERQDSAMSLGEPYAEGAAIAAQHQLLQAAAAHAQAIAASQQRNLLAEADAFRGRALLGSGANAQVYGPNGAGSVPHHYHHSSGSESERNGGGVGHSGRDARAVRFENSAYDDRGGGSPDSVRAASRGVIDGSSLPSPPQAVLRGKRGWSGRVRTSRRGAFVPGAPSPLKAAQAAAAAAAAAASAQAAALAAASRLNNDGVGAKLSMLASLSDAANRPTAALYSSSLRGPDRDGNGGSAAGVGGGGNGAGNLVSATTDRLSFAEAMTSGAIMLGKANGGQRHAVSRGKSRNENGR